MSTRLIPCGNRIVVLPVEPPKLVRGIHLTEAPPPTYGVVVESFIDWIAIGSLVVFPRWASGVDVVVDGQTLRILGTSSVLGFLKEELDAAG